MARHESFRNEMAALRVRCRAVCMEGDFKGPWRQNSTEAIADASGHRREPGNQNHEIRIVTEQSVSVKFLG